RGRVARCGGRRALLPALMPWQFQGLCHRRGWHTPCKAVAVRGFEPRIEGRAMTAGFFQDVEYALRALAARPVYAIASIAVLAIAIGANTTVFSVFNGLFLRPLPYPEGDRLVMVFDAYPNVGLDNAGTSIPSYLDRRE